MTDITAECINWKNKLALQRQAIIDDNLKNKSVYGTLNFENKNTPFSTTFDLQGNKIVDTSVRKYRFLNRDLTVSEVQARRKYEALKCLAQSNGAKGKFETKLQQIPKRFRYRMYGCPTLLTEATDSHVFKLPGKGNYRTLNPSIPFFAINGVGFGSSRDSDGAVAQFLQSASATTSSS